MQIIHLPWLIGVNTPTTLLRKFVLQQQTDRITPEPTHKQQVSNQ